MLFGVVGLSFRTAPIEVREKLSFKDSDVSDALSLLQAKDEIAESMIISTCNRVEIYALMREPRIALLRDFMRDFHKYSGDLSSFLFMESGEEAVKHICMVASGLDSMVLGEPQILGQVKEAYAKAVRYGSVDYVFEHLMSQVFSVAKKVRSRTRVGENSVSVSYAAVRLAQNLFTDFKNRKVMILGAGQMGEKTLRNLVRLGVRDILVANRTFSKAVELAERFSGTAIMLHEIEEYMASVDILISSVGAREFLVRADRLGEIMKKREDRPLFLVDISVPRSLDPRISSIEGCHIYNVDDLKSVSEKSARDRLYEAQKAMDLIDSKKGEIFHYIRSHDIVPTMVSIRARAEEIRKKNLEKAIGNLQLSEPDRQSIDSLTRSIVNKILHDSETKLREYSSALKKL
ncbi:MAG: glutamyl-tRNA reductase [Chitinispirillaceae bacterium]